MRTRPDKKWPGKYNRFVLSKSIKNLLSFLVILPPKWEWLLVMLPRGRRSACADTFTSPRLHAHWIYVEVRAGAAFFFSCVTSWCEVRITGLHRIGNTFVTWHASLFLSPPFAASLSLPACAWYQLRYRGAPHRRLFLNGGTFRTRFVFRASRGRRAIDGGPIDRSPILWTLSSPTAKFSVTVS